ncbi:MAG: hypothetical protein ACQESK_03400, partial [Bacteroidota bacterium]
MKKLYYKLLFFTLLCINSFYAQNQDFELYSQHNGSYNFKMIGNTMNVGENTFPLTCEALTASSASLDLEEDQEVVAAYLYWSGSGDIENPDYYTAELNGTEFQAEVEFNILASATGFSNLPAFGGFANVSEFVLQNGNIEYEFSGVDITQDLVNLPDICTAQFNHLGWAIVIIYEDESLDPVQLNVYNGYDFVGTGSPEIEFELDNLNVTETTDSSIGFIAWEGDDFIAVDETLQVNDVILGNPPLNPPNNIFNNTNSWTGSDELWNMDLDFFELDDDILEIGDTSIDVKITSGQDGVILHNFVTRISTELPDATVEIAQINDEAVCDNKDLNIDFEVLNANATSTLPSNVPISFFVLNEDDDEILLTTEFTTNSIDVGGSLNLNTIVTIPDDVPLSTQIIVRVNDDGDGNNPINESNLE